MSAPEDGRLAAAADEALALALEAVTGDRLADRHEHPLPLTAAQLAVALSAVSARPVAPGVWVGRLSTGHRILIRRPQGTGGEPS